MTAVVLLSPVPQLVQLPAPPDWLLGLAWFWLFVVSPAWLVGSAVWQYYMIWRLRRDAVRLMLEVDRQVAAFMREEQIRAQRRPAPDLHDLLRRA